MCLGTFSRRARSLATNYIFARVRIIGTLVPFCVIGDSKEFPLTQKTARRYPDRRFLHSYITFSWNILSFQSSYFNSISSPLSSIFFLQLFSRFILSQPPDLSRYSFVVFFSICASWQICRCITCSFAAFTHILSRTCFIITLICKIYSRFFVKSL